MLVVGGSHANSPPAVIPHVTGLAVGQRAAAESGAHFIGFFADAFDIQHGSVRGYGFPTASMHATPSAGVAQRSLHGLFALGQFRLGYEDVDLPIREIDTETVAIL